MMAQFQNKFPEVFKLGSLKVQLQFLNNKIIVDFIPTFIIFFSPSDSLVILEVCI